MKKRIVIGTVCFLSGLCAGLLTAPEKAEFKTSEPLMLRLSSQGRAEMRKTVQEINRLLDSSIDGIMAERTRMLQAVTAKDPDRTAADFYLSGMEEKIAGTQAAIDKALLDAIERMPLIDRRAYMDFHLENKSRFKRRGLVLPLAVETEIESLEAKTRAKVVK